MSSQESEENARQLEQELLIGPNIKMCEFILKPNPKQNKKIKFDKPMVLYPVDFYIFDNC